MKLLAFDPGMSLGQAEFRASDSSFNVPMDCEAEAGFDIVHHYSAQFHRLHSNAVVTVNKVCDAAHACPCVSKQ
jgi:hypothetical protein